MAGGKPYQSKLIPHENEIMAMRRKRPPMPYSKIAAVLNEKYQLNIALSGVYDFFKRRVTKKPRQYKYDAWDIELPEEPKQPEAPPVQMVIASKPSVQEKPKQEEMKENAIVSKPSVQEKPKQEVTVSKPYVQEKPKQEEKEKIDIDKIMAELGRSSRWAQAVID